jgi:DMSO/TMAO reductase YedYZ molybdopterin-dependent catalytic subunit
LEPAVNRRGGKSGDGKIVRSEDPLNLEMRFNELDGFITPTKSFYVRTHFPIPKIDKNKWHLQVEGEVERPLAISYRELLKLESRNLPATLECAGNNRNLLEPKVKGVQWGLGAVGNAEWTGIDLSAVLDLAVVRPGACELVLEGADGGTIEDPKGPPGELKFARSIPLDKARNVLLAYQMNDANLTPEHGFPLRAIVPGWYAMASVKWLHRIIVLNQPFNGYFQTLDYAYWQRSGNMVRRAPLSEMQVKAEIARPAEGETVRANSNVRVYGAAWTSNAEISKVEISTDGGLIWSEAKLLGESKVNAWRLWEFNWKTPADPGPTKLIARATDSIGRTQPVERDPDRGPHMINHLLPVTVEVR